jgi:predicted esterase
MNRSVILAALAIVVAADSTRASGPFDGAWRTSLSDVTLVQDGATVTGTYGNAQQFQIKGKVDGKALTFEFTEGNAKGDGRWTLDETGNAFSGGFQVRGGPGGQWNGWRQDPAAAKAPRAKFAGLWLTTSGLMELAEVNGKIQGKYAFRGTSDIEGTVTGRRLDYKFKNPRTGQGWFDLSSDGKTLRGAARTDGFPGWFGWSGRPAPEFVRLAPPQAGKLVEGSTSNLLTYTVRAPEGYKAGDKKTWPAILILHGSNMNGSAYVNTIAAAWPDLGKEYFLVGINGELPSNTGDAPAFNFSYQNWMGKSTYQGCPLTDRESPALVSEAMLELKKAYPIGKIFVGGHSQGGFLTSAMLMHFPDQFAGGFLVSGAVLMQAEPNAFSNDSLKKTQRSVPLAIVHGKTDPLVGYGSAEYASEIFQEARWPGFRLVSSDTAGHMFALLPVNAAIRWLEAMTSDDPEELLAFAGKNLEPGKYRDALFALDRAGQLKLTPAQDTQRKTLAATIDARARPKAAEFLVKIRSGKPGWIDDFLAFRDDFAATNAASEVMKAFDALRAQHEEPAKAAVNQARQSFQKGQASQGWAKYQEVIDKDFAASNYRMVKRWLRDKK